MSIKTRIQRLERHIRTFPQDACECEIMEGLAILRGLLDDSLPDKCPMCGRNYLARVTPNVTDYEDLAADRIAPNGNDYRAQSGRPEPFPGSDCSND